MSKYITFFIFTIALIRMSSAQVIPNFQRAEQISIKTAVAKPLQKQKSPQSKNRAPKEKIVRNGLVESYSWKHGGVRDEIYSGLITDGVPNGAGDSYTPDKEYEFSGYFVNGRFTLGKIYYKGSIWTDGPVNTDYKLEGFGKEYYKNRWESYEGDFINGARKGQGIYYDSEYRYEGLFDSLFIEGYIHFNDGCRYRGKLQDLKYSTNKGNKGTYYFANGDKYEGEFYQQQLHGKGTYTWRNGSKYTGIIDSGVINGNGELFDGTTTYRGTFKTLSDGRLNFEEEGTKRQLTFGKADGSAQFPVQSPKIYELWW